MKVTKSNLMLMLSQFKSFLFQKLSFDLSVTFIT